LNANEPAFGPDELGDDESDQSPPKKRGKVTLLDLDATDAEIEAAVRAINGD